jgi:hypothetical protein
MKKTKQRFRYKIEHIWISYKLHKKVSYKNDPLPSGGAPDEGAPNASFPDNYVTWATYLDH